MAAGQRSNTGAPTGAANESTDRNSGGRGDARRDGRRGDGRRGDAAEKNAFVERVVTINREIGRASCRERVL